MLTLLFMNCIIASLTVCQEAQYLSQKTHLILSDTRKIGVEGTMLQVNCTVSVSSPLYSLRWISRSDEISDIHQAQLRNSSHITVAMTIASLKGSDAGRYACVLLLADGQEETAEFELFIKRKETKVGTCGITQFKCKSTKHCIFLRYHCDGKDDCGDKSDEECNGDPCANKFRCNNTRCVDLLTLCDHMDNCGDLSDEGAICYDKPTSTTQTSSEDNQFGWLKITVSTVIASTVGLVILISFIVIMVFRVKMKRLREQRIARALDRLYQHGGVGEPTSSGHGDEVPSDQHPFLPSNSQYQFGNIIVNVNNGVQYMPGYDYSLFMDAPPLYSEVFNGDSWDNALPPPYSTIDRRTAQPRVEGPIVKLADEENLQSRPNISLSSVQNCLGGNRGADRVATVQRRNDSRSYAESDATPRGSTTAVDSSFSHDNSGTLPGISINPRFLQSLLGSHVQTTTGDYDYLSGSGQGTRTLPHERGLSTGSGCSDAGRIGTIRSGSSTTVNIPHLGASLQRSQATPSTVVSHSTQTPRHKVHSPGQTSTTVDIETRHNQSVPDVDAEVSIIDERQLPDPCRENSNTAETLHLYDNSEDAAPVSTTEVTVLESVSTIEDASVYVDAAISDVIDLHMDHPLVSENCELNKTSLVSSSSFVAPSHDHTEEDDSLPLEPPEFEDATCLLRKPRNRMDCANDLNQISDSTVLMPLSPGTGNSFNLDSASSALFKEVSLRDEKVKPRPGHLSVQRGQILLHTKEGILANDLDLSIPHNSSRQNTHLRSELGHPSSKGGELFVKDGSILLQSPQSVKRDYGLGSTGHAGRASSPSSHNEHEVDSEDLSCRSAPCFSTTNCNDAPLSRGSPLSSINQTLASDLVLANNTSIAEPADKEDNKSALSGKLTVRDGCLVLEAPKQTPSSQILSQLQGAYAAEELLANGPECKENGSLEPVVNTKRLAGVVARPPLPKFNSDFVLPLKNQSL